ncbi:protein prenylyltransferase [Thermothelomyces heterothallicus CBS 203.75]
MADQGGSQHGIARTSRVRTEEQRQRDLERIAKYRELEDQVRAHIRRGEYTPEVFQLTSKLLRLNPEYYTIWNARRRCLISGSFSRPSAGSSCSKASSNPALNEEPSAAEAQDLSIIKSELTFTIPLLLESPKCYWIWSYRLWILQQAIARLRPALARRIWEEELGLASKMLGKDRRNFHAWGYRRHVVQQLESATLEGSSMVEAEFAYTDKMIFNTDLSNFSAWHSRSKLIPRLLDERGADEAARRAFLDNELSQIRNALNVGPEDQSLWYYHQFLILNIVEPEKHPSMTRGFTREDRVAYLRREIDEIKDLLEDYEDVKLIYEGLFEYTLYLCQLEERQPDETERADLAAWLGKLKQLDPMRNGRWADLERVCGLKDQ